MPCAVIRMPPSTQRGHARRTCYVRLDSRLRCPVIGQRVQESDDVRHFALGESRSSTHRPSEGGLVLDILKILRWQVVELASRAVGGARIPILRLRVPSRVKAHGVLESFDYTVVKENMPFRYVA